MDAEFWHSRWQNNEIAFHQTEVNPHLLSYLTTFSLTPGSRVFVPLCGKTLDIAWLLAQGYTVVGVELSQIAIEQLFNALGVEPAITREGSLYRYSAHQIDIFVGDIFAMSTDLLGSVAVVYDRAALVALPEVMRKNYSDLVIAISGGAPQLLISFVYEQQLMAGPPFSVSDIEIKQLYSDAYALSLVFSAEMPEGLKGVSPVRENVWLLTQYK